MKILITNGVALNAGDAAIILSIIELLRIQFGQDTEFIIYDSSPNIASKYYPELVWRRSIYPQITQPEEKECLKNSLLDKAWKRLKQSWRYRVNLPLFYFAAWCQVKGLSYISKLLLNKEQLQDLYHYSSADLIVSTGGTYLVEIYSLKPRIFDYQVSLLMQRPLVFYTQSLGPFLNQNNRKILRKIFNESILILLRDELSLKNLQELGINEDKMHLSSDVVFSFKSNMETVNLQPSSNLYLNSKLKIAISVRFWQAFKTVSVETYMNSYRSAMCALTQYLVKKYNAEITYISTCQGIPEYWTDDSKIATEIYNLLPNDIQERVSVNSNFHTPQILLEMLKSYDLVIGTRMHMCILALTGGTPVFPIAYEFKTKELFARLGMSKWVQDIETINEESIIRLIEDFLVNLPQFKTHLMAQVEQEKFRAIKSGVLVKESLEKWQHKSM